jgi:hypothetical protein
LDRIAEPPLWWSNGVPRYERFRPAMTWVYAQEALLVDAKCQHCGRLFTMGLHSSRLGEYRRELEETDDIRIGDPPNHDCGGPGNSMQAVPLRILEFWELVFVTTNSTEWQRVTSLEGELPDD